ncbi:trichome birefringence-like protein 16 [Tanacetum coccineum]
MCVNEMHLRRDVFIMERECKAVKLNLASSSTPSMKVEETSLGLELNWALMNPQQKLKRKRKPYMISDESDDPSISRLGGNEMALMCMVTGGNEMADVEDVGEEYGLVKAVGSARSDECCYLGELKHPGQKVFLRSISPRHFFNGEWNTGALSLVRDEGHISRYSIRAAPGMQDCLHWCLPGVPDTWNDLLFAQI